VNLLARSVDLFRGHRWRNGAQADRIAAWLRTEAPSLRQAHAALRYVVVDVETTGLDTRTDRLIAIGAVGVTGSALHVNDAFAAVLRQPRPSAEHNILVHQIGGEAQLSGADPERALVDFLAFVGKAPLVAFHAQFDRTMLERAYREMLGMPLGLPWIDVAMVLPALYPKVGCESLDDWLVHFGVEVSARHDALADAWGTAELFLIALDAGARADMTTARDLMAAQRAQRWLDRGG
jgi:DNA polymerase III subunit epsilon